jgi:hypothetical protein
MSAEDNERDIDFKLSRIEGKLDDLSKKVAGKWFMPLVLVVITALMGIANFLVTRYYANTDLYGNKLKEKIAELQGEQILKFYTENLYKLDTVNLAFSKMCKFGVDSICVKDFNRVMPDLLTMNNKQLSPDTLVINKICLYTDYIADKEIDLESGELKGAAVKSVYIRSSRLYADAIKEINRSLDKITKD